MPDNATVPDPTTTLASAPTDNQADAPLDDQADAETTIQRIVLLLTDGTQISVTLPVSKARLDVINGTPAVVINVPRTVDWAVSFATRIPIDAIPQGQAMPPVVAAEPTTITQPALVPQPAATPAGRIPPSDGTPIEQEADALWENYLRKVAPGKHTVIEVARVRAVSPMLVVLATLRAVERGERVILRSEPVDGMNFVQDIETVTEADRMLMHPQRKGALFIYRT